MHRNDFEDTVIRKMKPKRCRNLKLEAGRHILCVVMPEKDDRQKRKEILGGF